MISSSSDPCLSGRVLRDLNEAEREETELMRQTLSIRVQPVDALTESGRDQTIDIRTLPEIA